MNLMIILGVGFVLSLLFHFIGVAVGAKKIIWVMLVFVWAIAIGVATNEIKPKGYADLEKLQKKYPSLKGMIDEAKPEISTYEMLGIQQKAHELKSAAAQ